MHISPKPLETDCQNLISLEGKLNSVSDGVKTHNIPLKNKVNPVQRTQC